MFTSSLLYVCISEFIDNVGYIDDLKDNFSDPVRTAYKRDSEKYSSEDIRTISQLKRSLLRAMYKKFARSTRTVRLQGK